MPRLLRPVVLAAGRRRAGRAELFAQLAARRPPQIEYVLQALRHADRHGIGSFEVRQSAQDTYNAMLHERPCTTVWTTGGCDSWYLDEGGGTSALWPGFTWSFRRALRRFDHENDVMHRAVPDPRPT